MYLLVEIATAQPALQSHLCALKAQNLIHGKLLSIPITSVNDKRLSSAWKSLGLSKELNFNARHLEVRRGRFLVKAVATLEPKGLVQNKNGQKHFNVSNDVVDSRKLKMESESSSEERESDERERLRRSRISKANKGNTPWNKGRKHSAGNDIFRDPVFLIYQSVSII